MQNGSDIDNAALSWQSSLQNALSNLDELCSFIGLSVQDHAQLQRAGQDFPICVPREFAARIQKGNPRDPLLLQVLPQAAELIQTAGYSTDPLAEAHFNPLPGLLQKYHGRVLITLTGRCAIHCRYCFRRHFPYQENTPGSAGREQLLEMIRNDHTIQEVILSGGDPLTVSDRVLQSLLAALETIPHVTTLRIHTRLPIVIPARVTHELIDLLKNTRLQCVMVMHVNHANEIDDSVIAVCQRLRAAGVMLLNQSVLLKAINDDVDTLVQLSHKLFAAGILPYYLHLCDKTQGTAHYDVNEAQANLLMTAIRARLPGYLVPQCVRETPGAANKVPLATSLRENE